MSIDTTWIVRPDKKSFDEMYLGRKIAWILSMLIFLTMESEGTTTHNGTLGTTGSDVCQDGERILLTKLFYLHKYCKYTVFSILVNIRSLF